MQSQGYRVYTGETCVMIGETDGYRYLGIKPQLTNEELTQIQGFGLELLRPQQIDEPGPAASLICVNGDSFQGGPTARTESAVKVGNEISSVLRLLRPRDAVKFDKTPVQMYGYKSTPFNPVTE